MVTGAARNLGRTIALGLAAAGYHVVVNTRTSRGEAEQVVEQAERLGVRLPSWRLALPRVMDELLQPSLERQGAR